MNRRYRGIWIPIAVGILIETVVELHSRSGARLGALFLDEGFGSVGVRTLVPTVSHLHAVAEAVEDVIWVERRPEGSSASWLSPAARDALVQQDVAGGLLSLVSRAPGVAAAAAAAGPGPPGKPSRVWGGRPDAGAPR